MSALDLSHLRLAHQRIAPYIHRTPVFSSSLLNKKLGGEIFFKCENLQKVGAFKARGAMNAILSLSEEEAKRGVVTHSSGNHGAAIAWAAGIRGISATIVVPKNAPAVKQAAIAAYGGTIVLCEPTVQSRESTVAQLVEEHQYCMIHPFDNDQVIAGQGTAAIELLEDIPDLDLVLTPLGGGGLLSGTSIAVKELDPKIEVYGAEPQGADDGFRSLSTGIRVTEQTPSTICDGLRTTLAERTFRIIEEKVDGIVVASDESILRAMRMTWEILKIIVEPSCMPPLAAILEGGLELKGCRAAILLTGGNVDLDRLPWQT